MIVSDDSHLKPLEWNMRLSNRMDAYDHGVTESVLSFTAGGNEHSCFSPACVQKKGAGGTGVGQRN